MTTAKKKKLKSRLIGWGIFIVAAALLVIFVGIPLYGPQPASTLPEPEINFYEDGAQTFTMESDRLLFELDAETTYFTVTDKESGQKWTAIPEDCADDAIANATNKEVIRSTLIVTYQTNAGSIELNSYRYSIQNGTYAVWQNEDSSISVEYSVGRIEKRYVIPTAITEERYKSFTGNMSKSTAKKVDSNYTKYDPARLDSRADKDEIIAMYPEVVNTPLYVLKSDTSETNKAKIEGYFEEGGYTQEDYEYDLTFVTSSTTKAGAVFNVEVIYRLDGDDLLVEIPYENIRYKEGYQITYLTVLPMFGAAGLSDDGFMFVPEGGGALIYNNNGKLKQNSYYSNLYGWDYASIRSEAPHETRVDFPVFGMSKGGSSFICVIEGASSFAAIQADISGRFNSYNWLCTKYNTLHTDRYNVSAKTDKPVNMYEKQLPTDTIVQRYRFIDSDSYVDMAKAYSAYLTEKGIIDDTVAEADMPISVELVGAINKTVEKLGLPVDSVVATTTFDQSISIIDDIKSSGLRNVSVRMTGWANGGIRQKVLSSVKPERVLGGKKGMLKLIEAAKNAGIDLYFDGITAFAYDSGLLQGFVPFSDAARYTTRQQVQLYPFSPVTFQLDEEQDSYYLVKPSYAQQKAENLISFLAEQKATGIAFRDIGLLLSADYNPKDLVTREKVKAMNIDVLKDAAAKGLKVIVKEGSDFTLPYADLVTEMDVPGTRYSLLDAMVPFYQIAIHGSVNYTGKAINLSSDYIGELLTSAEYGCGLHFCFMQADTKILQDSLHTGYYAAYYSSWKDEAFAMINRYQSEMAGLNNVRISGHERLAEDVSKTEYENGTYVLVNYTETPFDYQGHTIPARDYIVVRGN
ncbi:MAG: hypothetical protein IKR85_12060 [Clostridia bacterium]|nr:hypothetical protein [Clostridia bacterium]